MTDLVSDLARLAALDAYNILDTPSEAGFDDIVSLARLLCDVPVALISFVTTDRQWFKAREGFDACETPLAQSICAHAIAQGSLLIIPDLTQDPRTRENTLVTEQPAIRFYAGAPLIMPECATVEHHEPELTLEGLRLVYERNLARRGARRTEV